MKFAIQCPECRQRLKLNDELLGRKVRCKCGAIMRLPKSLTGQGSTDGVDAGSTISQQPDADDLLATPTTPPNAATHPQEQNRPGATATNEPAAVLNEWEEDLFGDLFSEKDSPPKKPVMPQSSVSKPAPTKPKPQSTSPPTEIHPAAIQPVTPAPAQREVVMPNPSAQQFPTLPSSPAQPAASNVPVADYSEPAVHPDVPQPSPAPVARPAPPQGGNAFPYATGTQPAPSAPYPSAAPQPQANMQYPEGYEQPYQPTRQEREGQMLDQYLEKDRWHNNDVYENEVISGLFGTGAGYGIGAGILMMLAGAFLFITGLFFDVLFCYAPVIFMIGFVGTIIGVIALIVDKTNRR